MDRFWVPNGQGFAVETGFGTVWASNLDPKAVPTDVSTDLDPIWDRLWSILEPFWDHFGTILRGPRNGVSFLNRPNRETSHVLLRRKLETETILRVWHGGGDCLWQLDICGV